MQHRYIKQIIFVSCIVLVSARTACAQSPSSTEALPAAPLNHTWNVAQLAGASERKLYVITLDAPNRRHTCRVQSFAVDKLVCKHAIGSPHAYELNQIAALIIPGDDVSTRRILLGLTAGIGAGIWGTVVLAATCPACAIATGIAAFILFAAVGAIGMTDDVPDRLLYLAPGQQLSKKLGYVRD